MLSKATFNSISVTSWRPIVLMEETRVPGENHRPVASHRQTSSHNVVSTTPRTGFDLTTLNIYGDRHWLHR